jgi:general secretion pathway protein K
MKPQRGAALIVAMLIVALAVIATSNFVFHTHIHWRKLENAANTDQARWLVRAAEQWGATVLLDDALQNSVDHLGETWGREMPPIVAEGYHMSGRILEQNGLFNLNNLVLDGKVNDSQLAVFRRLLRNAKLSAGLANAVADWLDADDAASGESGAESEYYLRQSPPVRAANRPIVNLNELLHVRGMTPELLEQLRPYVSVLPKSGPINVNTAPPQVIAALSDTMSLDEAHVLVAKRDHAHFRNAGDLRNAMDNKPGLDERLVSFASQYFLVVVQIRHDRIALESQALFERNGQNFPNLVWRAAR